jgi:hypothetical protein
MTLFSQAVRDCTSFLRAPPPSLAGDRLRVAQLLRILGWATLGSFILAVAVVAMLAWAHLSAPNTVPFPFDIITGFPLALLAAFIMLLGIGMATRAWETGQDPRGARVLALSIVGILLGIPNVIQAAHGQLTAYALMGLAQTALFVAVIVFSQRAVRASQPSNA